MRTLVFLLEEPSAEEMLKGVLPRILPDDIFVRYLVFEGKQDLEKKLERRIRGWMAPQSFFVVMRDQDSADCFSIKRNLLEKCRNAGRVDSLVRIACRELESFYLGDLEAVEKGLNIKNLGAKQNKSKYRSPDTIGNPEEELISLTDKRYQKVSGSRAIGPHLALDDLNRSHSFNVLVSGIKSFVGTDQGN